MKHSSKNKGPSQRQLRVGEQVRHAIATMLQRNVLVDPLLNGIVLSVSEVRMSPDLKIATSYIAPLGDVDGALIVETLNRHTRFIRGELSHDLRQMKYMPEFRFRLDTSFDNFSKIEALLRSPEVMRDLKHEDEDE
ncbi:30S ribosome-binding factor RbfA [Bartonella tamiae]|uniref:Ribosome-binding factor A n=1 Tax=Bartonella tamiae Th239 TaxID=1094558 RepID=J1K1C9_9HYPH|nr:30S ribosome-binding factor RbfA [Bartonella tamiae]EJF91262.1 ribosome-binding factor A [Bartonella tamiae Th239]EJF93073.1 ribosome-binding factor A [Bartonella tamiae Th307]